MRKHSLIPILFGICFIINGCAEILDSTPDTDSMTGKITKIESNEFGIRILVEENTDVREPLEEGGKKTWYAITEKSELLKVTEGTSLRAIDEESLVTGQIVKAWSTGVHMLSYPSQTGAKRVIVLN